MNRLTLALAMISTAAALQVPSAFASVPGGCTGNPHDTSGKTSSGFEGGNPHDSIKSHLGEGDICPGS